jgi:predicted DCC family thiol-disulfide oxidoreductase YuxK
MTGDNANHDTPWTVLYDSDCGFCKCSLALLLQLDRHHRLRPLGLTTPEADSLLSDLTPEQRAASWHLVSPSEQRWSAGLALAPVLRLLGPAGRPPAALLQRTPRTAQRGYAWVAANRSTFGRWLPSGAKRRATRTIARREGQAAASSGRCSAR